MLIGGLLIFYFGYERMGRSEVQPYRPIDTFMLKVRDDVDYMKADITDSIILTVHNQENVIKDVLAGIENNTKGYYELIMVLDGCTDGTEKAVFDYMGDSSLAEKTIFKYTDNIYENKANTVGMKEAIGKYVTIVQDDQVINEEGWNVRNKIGRAHV